MGVELGGTGYGTQKEFWNQEDVLKTGDQSLLTEVWLPLYWQIFVYRSESRTAPCNLKDTK